MAGGDWGGDINRYRAAARTRPRWPPGLEAWLLPARTPRQSDSEPRQQDIPRNRTGRYENNGISGNLVLSRPFILRRPRRSPTPHTTAVTAGPPRWLCPVVALRPLALGVFRSQRRRSLSHRVSRHEPRSSISAARAPGPGPDSSHTGRPEATAQAGMLCLAARGLCFPFYNF